jgi:hypothetical protein
MHVASDAREAGLIRMSGELRSHLRLSSLLGFRQQSQNGHFGIKVTHRNSCLNTPSVAHN